MRSALVRNPGSARASAATGAPIRSTAQHVVGLIAQQVLGGLLVEGVQPQQVCAAHDEGRPSRRAPHRARSRTLADVALGRAQVIELGPAGELDEEAREISALCGNVYSNAIRTYAKREGSGGRWATAVARHRFGDLVGGPIKRVH